MPLTTTIDDIKAYQDKVEKNKVTSKDLNPCPRCNLEPIFFKTHAYRERRFLIIVEMLVEAVLCTLLRFRCTGCGKTFTYYPDFAIPHKHYIRQTILNISKSYIEDDQKSYQDAVMNDAAAHEYSDGNKEMSPSTLYRWISTLADLFIVYKKSLAANKPSTQHNVNPINLIFPKKKYRTSKRKECLLMCRYFLTIVTFCKNIFSPSMQ